jgi:GNAT superfamily N-acetyltransferase
MSFWSKLLVPERTSRFESLIRPLDIPSVEAVQIQDPQPLLKFLRTYFGTPPTTPVYQPVLDPSQEIILCVQDQEEIVASIRYKYAGLFESRPIHIIDCFCVHPRFRGTGLASKLLATLHTHTNDRGLRYSLFLKEGRALPNQEPLYSSSYVYRRLPKGDLKGALSPRTAAALVAAYRQLYPDTVWLYDVANTNQHWLLWKQGLEWILLCIQNAYQTHQGGSIGWVTAFFASEPVRSEPFEALIDQAPYDWIWMDRAWCPSVQRWTNDGPFHWYAYQWTTNLRFSRFYGLIV